MLQKLKKRIKNQRGMTLVELLAVIVILGIISAIAVPSIGGLIDNTKKDAHIANAQQMLNSTKIAIAQDTTLQNTAGAAKFLTLAELESKGYLDPVDSPDPDSYQKGTTLDTDNTAVSYVKIIDGKIYGVNLVTLKRGISVLKSSADIVAKNAVSLKDFNRDLVVNK